MPAATRTAAAIQSQVRLRAASMAATLGEVVLRAGYGGDDSATVDARERQLRNRVNRGRRVLEVVVLLERRAEDLDDPLVEL